MSTKRGKKKAFLRSLLGKSLLVPAFSVPGRIAARLTQDGTLVPGRVTAIDKVNPGCVVVRLDDDTRRFFFKGELVQQWVTGVQRPQGANQQEITAENASMQDQQLQSQQEEGEDDSYDAARPAPRQTAPGTSTPWGMHPGGVVQPSTVPLYHHSAWMRRFVSEDFLLKQQAAAAAARERHEEEASGTTQHPGGEATHEAGVLQSGSGWEHEAAARPSNSCSHGDQQSADTGDDHRHAAAQQAHDLSITAAAAATGLPGLAEAALQEAQQEEQLEQQQQQRPLKQQQQEQQEGTSPAQRQQSPALSTGQHSFNPASQQRSRDSKQAAAPTPAPAAAAAASDQQAGHDEQPEQPADTSPPGATSSSVPPPPAAPASWEKPKRGRTKRSQCLDLIGQVVEVPGNVFDVDVPELVYRAKVVGPDNAHADAVVLRLLEDGTKFYFPIGQVRSWIGDQTRRHRQHAPCTGQHTTGALSDAFAAEVLASMSAGPSSTSQLSPGGAAVAAAKPTNSHTCTSQQRQLQGPARRKQRFADSGKAGDGGGGGGDEELEDGEVAAA